MRRTSNASALATAALLLAARPAFASGGGIEIVPDPFHLGMLVLAFALLIIPVDRLLLKPLLRVLDERDQRIAGSRERAQKIEAEADETLGRYRDSIREARESANAERRHLTDEGRAREQETTGAARGEAEQEVMRARGEIETALGEARANLRSAAEQLARDAAERVLGRSLS